MMKMNKKIIGLIILFIIVLGGFAISSFYSTDNTQNNTNNQELNGNNSITNELNCIIPLINIGENLNIPYNNPNMKINNNS